MRTVLSLWRGPVTLGRPTMKQIAEPVALSHGFTLAELKAKVRRRDLDRARHEVMHALCNAGYWSTPLIGRFLERDHSSVVHGRQQHDLRCLRAQREAA